MRKRLPRSLPGAAPEALLAAAGDNPRDRALVLIGLYLGLRVAEIVKRRVEDLDFAGGICQVRHGKGDKDRALPIPARVAGELAAWANAQSGPWLFPGRSRNKPLSVRTAQLVIKRLAERAGLPAWITPHKLRHTFATRLLRAGADIIEVRDLLGHSSVATTELYLSAAPERLRAAVDRL